jgi:23S rRNA pseudouridine2605 synthase
MAERLQKVLARAGFGSRRQIENWIRDGKITVNGKLAELGVSISDTDLVKI